MGYRPQLFFEKNQEYELIGESNNCIPLFWAVIFYENQYTITAGEELYYPTLTINHQELHIPDYHFDGEVHLCWQDFTDAISKKAKEGSDLVLDLSDILEMDTEVEALKTIEDVASACRKFLEEMKDYYLAEGKDHTLSYDSLLAFCNLPAVAEEKYQSLIIKQNNTIKSNSHAIPKGKSKIRMIMESIAISIISILICIYSFIMIISGEQIILNILSVLLFGGGGVFYLINSFDKIKNSNN